MATNTKGRNIRCIVTREDVIGRLIDPDEYDYFKRHIADRKRGNEADAGRIIQENVHRLTREHLRRVIELVDYRHYMDAPPRDRHLRRHRGGRWFYRLLGPANTKELLRDENEQRIGQWFHFLVDDKYSASEKIDLLRSRQYRIKGIAHGFITLMLYLLNKAEYTIWFEELHKGLKRVCDIEEFKNRTYMGGQYEAFNDAAKGFAAECGFDHTELDWVLSELAKDATINQQ